MLLAVHCVIMYSGMLHDISLDSGRAPSLVILTMFAFLFVAFNTPLSLLSFYQRKTTDRN